jgi:hypothetical protein
MFGLSPWMLFGERGKALTQAYLGRGGKALTGTQFGGEGENRERSLPDTFWGEGKKKQVIAESGQVSAP